MVGGIMSFCSATLVGKHHIITASHCAMWHNLQDDSPPDRMIFQPGYNLGSMYPNSNVIYSYWNRKVVGSTVQEDIGGDWLVGILDRDMQVSNGLFGQLQYNSGLNGLYLWDASGYPKDGFSAITGQQVVQGPMAVIEVRQSRYGERYFLEGDVESGESGGPLYGMLKGLPQLIGTIAGDTESDFLMIAHSGPEMFNLIAKAIEEFP
jgi:V8-like Glu-specific endopeptidase